jgi:hypothetical protein
MLSPPPPQSHEPQIYKSPDKVKTRGKTRKRWPRGRADMERCRHLIVAFAVLCLCGGAARGEKSNEEVRHQTQAQRDPPEQDTKQLAPRHVVCYSTASKTRAQTSMCSLRSGGDSRKGGRGGEGRGWRAALSAGRAVVDHRQRGSKASPPLWVGWNFLC